ncbi:hypothetical protein F4818DRAFT_446386 [Hypoxylon cercidicola]|nr:hypothetical protein F4818DRAFT_446386 [Hypoxylon cercidicola]
MARRGGTSIWLRAHGAIAADSLHIERRTSYERYHQHVLAGLGEARGREEAARRLRQRRRASTIRSCGLRTSSVPRWPRGCCTTRRTGRAKRGPNGEHLVAPSARPRKRKTG